MYLGLSLVLFLASGLMAQPASLVIFNDGIGGLTVYLNEVKQNPQPHKRIRLEALQSRQTMDVKIILHAPMDNTYSSGGHHGGHHGHGGGYGHQNHAEVGDFYSPNALEIFRERIKLEPGMESVYSIATDIHGRKFLRWVSDTPIRGHVQQVHHPSDRAAFMELYDIIQRTGDKTYRSHEHRQRDAWIIKSLVSLHQSNDYRRKLRQIEALWSIEKDFYRSHEYHKRNKWIRDYIDKILTTPAPNFRIAAALKAIPREMKERYPRSHEWYRARKWGLEEVERIMRY